MNVIRASREENESFEDISHKFTTLGHVASMNDRQRNKKNVRSIDVRKN